MRLGLANLSLLLALSVPAFRENPAGETAGLSLGKSPAERSGLPLFSPQSYCLLALLKVTGQAFITGTFLSYVFLFSLAGSAVSAALMYGLRRLFGTRISLAGISVAGAFASNSVQLVLARFFLFGESAAYLAPPFLAAGIVSGAALGIFADVFAARSRLLRTWAREPPAPAKTARAPDPPEQEHTARTPARRNLPSLPLFFAGLGAGAVFLVIPRPGVKAALLVLFWLLAVLAGKKPRLLAAAVVMAGIVICNLFPPFGRIIASAGPFTVALGSLESGVRKALNFEGLVMLSRLIVSAEPRLPGAFGNLLAETFRILDRFNSRRSLFTGAAGKDNDSAANNNTANPARKKRFMERLDLLLLEQYTKHQNTGL
jgi:heptaprenyl diphosphate synthase